MTLSFARAHSLYLLNRDLELCSSSPRSEVRDFSLSLHSLNRDLVAVVDIHSGLGRLAAYLEALQRPPVRVVVGIVSSNGADTCQHCAHVDDVGIPRCEPFFLIFIVV